MKNRQSDNKSTMQIRIDIKLHRLIKIKAAAQQQTIKSLVESVLVELIKIGDSND